MKKACLIFIFSVLCINLQAQNYQLHAVYMYQFTKYIKWPDAKSTGDFIIGVIGETPATEYLERMAKVKKVGSRDIVITKYESIENINENHMLFIGKGAVDSISELIGKIGESGTLIVSEEEGFGLEGSNINFVERNGRLVFELNQDAMRRENLRVSSELSRLAIVL